MDLSDAQIDRALHEDRDPERHMSQPMQALEIGNVKRFARARLREKIVSGEKLLSEVVEEAPAVLITSHRSGNSVTIAELLTWKTGWGEVRAERVLRPLGLRSTSCLHHLSTFRRRQLAKSLADLGV